MSTVPPLPPPDVARLTLATLGGLSLSRTDAAGASRTEPVRGKPLVLLVYLACSPGRAASREHLLDLLWADADPEAGRISLRTTLHRIRVKLGDGIVSAGNETLALRVPLACDRDDFLHTMEARDHEAAVRRYTGDFLAAVAVPSGGANFERWAELERERLRAMFLHAVGTAVRTRLSAGHPYDALALARRARDVAPTDERAWRLVLESRVAAHDFIGAAIDADAVERMLAEHEREPETATTRLLRLARHLPAPAGPPAGPQMLVADLIGRESEFVSVVSAWDDGRIRPGRHFHVTGTAGVGKTRLLTDLQGRLRSLRTRPVVLRCHQGERQLPYAMAGELAGALGTLRGASGVSPAVAGSLVALNPALSAVFPSAALDASTGGEALRRRTIGVADLLAAVAENRPTAVFVDDVHWADAPSRQILLGVIARARERAVLIVTAGRPEATELHTGETVVLALDPLEPHEVGALVANLGALPPAPWADGLGDELHAATGGSPLLVLETLQLAIERGTLARDAQGWRCPDARGLRALFQRGGALRHRVAQLEPDERTLLRVLAVAGVPLTLPRLTRTVGAPGVAIGAALTALEQRGLADRVADEWRPAHDEIAAATLDVSAPRECQWAYRAVGRVFADEAEHDRSMLRKAAPLLAAGGDDVRLASVFAQWVAEAHGRGDRRRLVDLAAEVLGEEGRPDHIARLTRGLPLHVRLGLDSSGRLAAVALLVLAVAGATAVVAAGRGEPAPEALLVGLQTAEQRGGPVARVAPLSRKGWDEQDTIALATIDASYPPALITDQLDATAVHPSGGRWAIVRTTADSGGLDLWLVDRGGRERRLTGAPGDDAHPAWSPDGRNIAFSTDRWGAGRSRADIAVLDTATLEVRALTQGPDYDMEPSWSPDGTRIAFARMYFDRPQPTALCWTTLEAVAPRCVTPDDYPVQQLLGWKDPEHLLVAVDSGGIPSLASVDVGGTAVRLVGSGNGTRMVSPDGQWVACRCTRRGYRGLSWYVFPIERPEQAKPVRFGAVAANYRLGWGGVPGRLRFLATLTIDTPPPDIARDTRYQFRTRGVDSRGRPIGVYGLRWWTGDSSVAAIDSAGILVPRREGRVTVHASAGGWRSDSVTVSIGPPRAVVRLHEDWRGALSERWVPYGEPPPRIVVGPGGTPAFLNAGDSTWPSGAYSRMRFQAAAGLGVETTLSVPITEVQWQQAFVRLGQARDTAIMARWDHRSARVSPLVDECTAAYPGGDGAGGTSRVAVWTSVLSRGIPVDPGSVARGQWTRVRIQLFPDGRCGFALNGRPVWISETDIAVDRPFRVLLEGKSYHTRVLAGPLDVWEGVRGDIDWSAVGPTATAPPLPRRP